MKIDDSTGLVLEGGGLRWVFTCGVLDCFMDHVDGIPMIDGGIADSIPVGYAMSQGYEKLVVVLTRNKGYRKKNGTMPLSKVIYRKYPKLQEALSQHNAVYNKTMDLTIKYLSQPAE